MFGSKVVVLTFGLLVASAAWAHEPPAIAPAQRPAGAAQVAIPFEKYRLPNGLEVILSEDHRLPNVAMQVWYHAGALQEAPGQAGVAHLFEHLVLFNGTPHVGDGLAMLQRIGAPRFDGSTDFDRTAYYETVPSHQLESALWLESDRMGFLLDALTSEKLEAQRAIVKNERRERIETAPYRLGDEQAWKALFPVPHPWNAFGIGSMADLDAASMDGMRSFFRTWYAPANATLALVGDFDSAEAKRLVAKYFGTLPSPPAPAHAPPAPAELAGPVVIRAEEKIAMLPKVKILWPSPAAFTDGDADAQLLAYLLTGRSGRLQRRLVVEKELAQSVSAWQQSLDGQSVFAIEAIARPGVTSEQLLTEIDRVLNEVRARGVTEGELRQAQQAVETEALLSLQSIENKAQRLQRYEHYLGDPGKLEWDLARFRAVTPASVRGFAWRVLDGERRVVLHAVPASPK